MKHEAGHASFPHRGTAPFICALLLWIVVENNPSSFETETYTHERNKPYVPYVMCSSMMSVKCGFVCSLQQINQ